MGYNCTIPNGYLASAAQTPRGAIRIGLNYEYTLTEDKLLSDYNMEAQGNLLADYWAFKVTCGKPTELTVPKYLSGSPLYEKVLANFIANPADKKICHKKIPFFENMISILKFFLVILITGWCSVSIGMSSRGDVVISDSKGLPCFTIEENSDTKDGIPMYTLVVSELTSLPGEVAPAELWGFSYKYGNPVTILPQSCIRYGEIPPGAEERAAKKLVPYKIYAVSIGARPKGTNILGYKGEFCIKPTEDRSIFPEIIARKNGEKERFYDLCKNPASRNN